MKLPPVQKAAHATAVKPHARWPGHSSRPTTNICNYIYAIIKYMQTKFVRSNVFAQTSESRLFTGFTNWTVSCILEIWELYINKTKDILLMNVCEAIETFLQGHFTVRPYKQVMPSWLLVVLGSTSGGVASSSERENLPCDRERKIIFLQGKKADEPGLIKIIKSMSLNCSLFIPRFGDRSVWGYRFSCA